MYRLQFSGKEFASICGSYRSAYADVWNPRVGATIEVTKNGMILMNILDRMLETTAIDATDVETDKTLLECA